VSEESPIRALVTGGAGFIGSHLVDVLLPRGWHVTVVDDLSTGRRANLAAHVADPAHAGRLEFIESSLDGALRGPLASRRFDRVFHLAAAVGVRRIIERPIESIETNVIQTAALLRFVADHAVQGWPMPPTLIASSSEVYGKSTAVPFKEEDDSVFGPTTAFRWSYACSKALDEHLALAYHGQAGLPAVVARFFNTVGPRQVGEYGMVLPNFVRAALEGRPPQVFGTGAQSRCFCDVRDIAPALPALLESPSCYGRVFNLGSDEPISMWDLAGLVVRTLGGGPGPELVPYETAYTPGFEDLQQRRPDLTRVRHAIGFRPRIPLLETIRDIAASMRTIEPRSGPPLRSR